MPSFALRQNFENYSEWKNLGVRKWPRLYRLDGQPLRKPENQLAFPAIEKLQYHYENEFRD